MAEPGRGEHGLLAGARKLAAPRRWRGGQHLRHGRRENEPQRAHARGTTWAGVRTRCPASTRPRTLSPPGTRTGPAAVLVPGAGRAGGAHLALGDRLQSPLCCSIRRLAALPAVKSVFKFRLRDTLKVHPLYPPLEPPKCNLKLPNFLPSDCPMGSASHLLLCPHLLRSSPCSLCASCWPPCNSCDRSRALRPRGLCTCCVRLASSSHHSDLCSDVTFQKALSEIGTLHWHPTLYPHSLLLCLSTLYINSFAGLLTCL